MGSWRQQGGCSNTRQQDLEQALSEAPRTALPDDATERLATLDAGVSERTRSVGVFEDRLQRDDGERGKVDAMRREMEGAAAEHATWADVNQAIGSGNGATFRQNAQEITLKAVVALANEQLGMLSLLYRLARGDALSLHVADMDMGGEARASRSPGQVASASSVSLGLAPALSSLEGASGLVRRAAQRRGLRLARLGQPGRRGGGAGDAPRLRSQGGSRHPASPPWWSASRPRSGSSSAGAAGAWSRCGPPEGSPLPYRRSRPLCGAGVGVRPERYDERSGWPEGRDAPRPRP